MISVMGYVGMLLNGQGWFVNGAADQVSWKSLIKNLLKLGKNIDNLFDLAELRIQKEGLAFESVNLSAIIEFSCSTIEPLAREHQITLHIQLPPDPVIVRGAEEKLSQLFDNLCCTNAIKYNRQAEGSMWTSINRRSEICL